MVSDMQKHRTSSCWIHYQCR